MLEPVLAKDSKEDLRLNPQIIYSSVVSASELTEDEAYNFRVIVELYIAIGAPPKKLLRNANMKITKAFGIFQTDYDGWKYELLSKAL